MKLALASLEAEAVAFVMADDLKDSSIISTPAYRDLGEAMERTVGDMVALYTAPPAPVTINAEPVAWLWSHRKHPSEVTLVRPEMIRERKVLTGLGGVVRRFMQHRQRRYLCLMKLLLKIARHSSSMTLLTLMRHGLADLTPAAPPC